MVICRNDCDRMVRVIDGAAINGGGKMVGFDMLGKDTPIAGVETTEVDNRTPDTPKADVWKDTTGADSDGSPIDALIVGRLIEEMAGTLIPDNVGNIATGVETAEPGRTISVLTSQRQPRLPQDRARYPPPAPTPIAI